MLLPDATFSVIEQLGGEDYFRYMADARDFQATKVGETWVEWFTYTGPDGNPRKIGWCVCPRPPSFAVFHNSVMVWSAYSSIESLRSTISSLMGVELL